MNVLSSWTFPFAWELTPDKVRASLEPRVTLDPQVVQCSWAHLRPNFRLPGRNLSEQSRIAAENVGEIVETISTTFKELFNNLQRKMENVASVSEEVAASAEEVSAAAEEISSSMEEMTSSAQNLADQAADSNEKVATFIVE